ncbi:hypothetical protein EXU85_13470 [Spirosoma sp. KCTC 42546]|uniref:hypothetical protein n=1 Tax=Spirosoma sp. KCTC 42546 TaxID=2520506 RepID=UPI00115951FF|nr:hypothetical protein [Spirosoma sp. KCTC 42546]QDK79557.1 hypothetical protein EXU85_13470 [Spirosoma sp. KCTC 42546]
MNTEQNYVGKGDYATTLPQSAQNEAQTSSTVDNRQPNPLLSSQYRELHRLINGFLNEAGTSGPVELVNELLQECTHRAIGFDPESDYEPSKEYPITQADLTRIFNATQLTQFLVRLGETWQRIEKLY